MRATIAVLTLALATTPALAQEAPIEIVAYEVDRAPQDIMGGRLYDQTRLRLEVANRTDQAITAWRAKAVLTDPFGDELLRVQLTSGESIAAGATRGAVFAWDDNPYISDEPADKIGQYLGSKIGISLEDVRVVH